MASAGRVGSKQAVTDGVGRGGGGAAPRGAAEARGHRKSATDPMREKVEKARGKLETVKKLTREVVLSAGGHSRERSEEIEAEKVKSVRGGGVGVAAHLLMGDPLGALVSGVGKIGKYRQLGKEGKAEGEYREELEGIGERADDISSISSFDDAAAFALKRAEEKAETEAARAQRAEAELASLKAKLEELNKAGGSGAKGATALKEAKEAAAKKEAEAKRNAEAEKAKEAAAKKEAKEAAAKKKAKYLLVKRPKPVKKKKVVPDLKISIEQEFFMLTHSDQQLLLSHLVKSNCIPILDDEIGLDVFTNIKRKLISYLKGNYSLFDSKKKELMEYLRAAGEKREDVQRDAVRRESEE